MGCRDRRSLGRSRVAPFIPGESKFDRHARRKHIACEMRAEAIAQAEQLGFAVRILNNGEHWQFSNGRTVIEWWPSSAKLVRDKKWERGVHAHDVTQVLKMLANPT